MNQIKGEEYEIFIKQFLENDSKKTWLWKDIPEYELRKSSLLGDWNEHRLVRKDNKINSLPDLGSDILLKDEEKYILIQCKNFDLTNNVTIHHLAGFYAMISHHNLCGIVYYSSKLSPNIKLLKPSSNIQFIKQEIIIHHPEIIHKTILNPYYYQIDAYEQLKNSKRAILNLPCGMGKTYTTYLMAKYYNNIIILSPLRYLAFQTLEQYKKYLGPEYSPILISLDGKRKLEDISNNLEENNSEKNEFYKNDLEDICTAYSEEFEVVIHIRRMELRGERVQYYFHETNN
jgi:hypothetical protein